MINDQSPLAHLDDRAKRTVELARRRADGLRSRVIGPEHVLLALLTVRHGMASRAVTSLAGSCATAEDAIAGALVPGPQPSPAHIPFTEACEEAMVRAARQARQLGYDRIGTEHLLLGLLQATADPTVGRLSDLGVTYAATRAEIERLRADD
ncbi:Clp protease N-terminal domain-containing protein [Actinoplanes sp. NPDC049668]|uniref:Clp protease N-terminal domain-containing protein n=1 Tax=unclassified Actinoplanes TaxID=2626549 RepID=UPI0033B62C2A